MLLKKTTSIKTIITISLGILFVFALSTCKKYPDNDLWFKSPESVLKTGQITSYTIDGIDNVPVWNALLNTPPYGGFPPPAAGRPNDFLSPVWTFDTEKNQILSAYGRGEYHFFNNKKELYLYFYMYDGNITGQPVTYHIFCEREGNWKILKLTKSGALRIQRTYNNKVYEIQFN